MRTGTGKLVRLLLGITALNPLSHGKGAVPKEEIDAIQARYAAQEQAASSRLAENPKDVSA